MFFSIFDYYEYNEKKWVINQINSILKGLKQDDIAYFKKNIFKTLNNKITEKIFELNQISIQHFFVLEC